MWVTVNGEERELAAGTTVQDVLQAAGAPAGARGYAVALDGTVLPRGEWPSTALSPGTRLELVVAVQGG